MNYTLKQETGTEHKTRFKGYDDQNSRKFNRTHKKTQIPKIDKK